MLRFLLPALAVLLLAATTARAEPADASTAATPLVRKIRAELAGPPTEDSKVNPDVPHGELVEGVLSDSKVYPGTDHPYTVYVPAQYNPAKPACLLLRLDRLADGETTVFDNLIAKGDMPVTIAVGVASGTVWKTKGSVALRWNRSYEFDSMNGNLPDYVLNELLPRIEKLKTKDGRTLHLSQEAKDRAVMGGSTGGIGSFTLAWQRPDSFSRVYSSIGTFVAMRGGNEYPALIRKTEPKAIRIFLEDGSTDAWNPLFGSWFMANENMEAALNFAGYEVEHAWGVHGHSGAPAEVILPDVLRWLWQGWPAAVAPGQSQNDMLAAIVRPGEVWQQVGGARKAAGGLACNQWGDVYCNDAAAHAIYRISTSGETTVFAQNTPAISSEAFGPDGTLFATAPAEGEIMAYDIHGAARKITDGVHGNRILVTKNRSLYVSEPGAHADEPGTLWLIGEGGEKKAVDTGLLAASGLAVSPDLTLLYAAEHGTQSVYSYVLGPDGSLLYKEPFFWLHQTDVSNGSGAEDLATDRQGTLYVATRMGIQVCDRNGRVRAILPLPFPCGPLRNLCWGGPDFETLYVTDGTSVFKRNFRIAGHPSWAAPVLLPKANAG